MGWAEVQSIVAVALLVGAIAGVGLERSRMHDVCKGCRIKQRARG